MGIFAFPRMQIKSPKLHIRTPVLYFKALSELIILIFFSLPKVYETKIMWLIRIWEPSQVFFFHRDKDIVGDVAPLCSGAFVRYLLLWHLVLFYCLILLIV